MRAMILPGPQSDHGPAHSQCDTSSTPFRPHYRFGFGEPRPGPSLSSRSTSSFLLPLRHRREAIPPCPSSRPIPAIRLRVWLRAVVSNHLYRFLLTNASSFRRILPRSVCVSVLGGGSSSLFFLSGQILANPSHICGAGVCELVLRHHIKPSAPCLVPVRYIPPI